MFALVSNIERFGTSITVTHFLEIGPANLVVLSTSLAHFEQARGFRRSFVVGDNQTI